MTSDISLEIQERIINKKGKYTINLNEYWLYITIAIIYRTEWKNRQNLKDITTYKHVIFQLSMEKSFEEFSEDIYARKTWLTNLMYWTYMYTTTNNVYIYKFN